MIPTLGCLSGSGKINILSIKNWKQNSSVLNLAKSKDGKCGKNSQNVKTRNEFRECLTCHFIDRAYIQYPLVYLHLEV